MKLICIRENLKRALSLASKIVSTTSTLPILNNVLLKTESGQLLVSATNLELAIKVMIGCQVETVGDITVPARTITEYVSALSDDKIFMATNNTDLTITTTKAESVLKGLPAEEFPLVPEVKPKMSVGLDAQALAHALGQVAFATALSETQPELSGVLFDFNDNVLRLAATDRYRLAEKTLSLPHAVEATKIIVPSRAIAELPRILGEEQKTVEILIADAQVMFRTPTVECISRLIDGNYPDYQQIIPREFTTQVTLPTAEFSSALKLSGLFVADNSNVELLVSTAPGRLILRSTSAKFGSNTTQISGDVVGEDNQIVFNYRYILDCLNHLKEQQVTLNVINASSPAMLIPHGATDYRYLVMPIKT